MSGVSRRDRKLRKLSRFLSMLLRHQPARFPVRLDDQGYTALSDVMRVLRALPNFRWATRADIDEIVGARGRAKFEIVQDDAGTRIRALYGHTAVRPVHALVTPPDVLYVAVTPERVREAVAEGLLPGETGYVELVSSAEEARRLVAHETDRPTVFAVDTPAAMAAGCAFHSPAEGIYLVARVVGAHLTQLS